MKIQSGCFVELLYQIKNPEGEVVITSDDEGPMNYLHGYGEIPEVLEEKLSGAEEGAAMVIHLGPGEAYGDYNPDGIISVPRSQFPEDAEIVPGDWIGVTVSDDEDEDAEGEEVEMRVVEISPEAIVLDANHPLAGKAVVFDVHVVSVRQATEEEIAEHQAEVAADEDDES